ncbi:class I SAM-dependent methyltransferase [Nocardioides massiliensis]|uniref:2-polyprenyl-3-methyl-5-hydroxy-6-metoxy-1, 4-benzoquinol methylase n=1 Tax=Nocardioides massiliensis TaxID=1325935 RepID=A0ABT9NW08_9ACTN|nr:class I SAM-dependent methyltransferase [Nocardioides massiliensis]MDP9824015.1 2-polyprenyl-3-methyl-5-hydroxy-6-metoxy-1,4-benzoquinol methylase [Nocardioides massiliensis]
MDEDRHGHGHGHSHGHEGDRFDDAAATWDDDPDHERRQQAVAELIASTVPLSPQSRALDVGGGTGRLSILLADRVGSVTVTDPSIGMVQVAQERIEAAGLTGRMRAVQADLSQDRLEGEYDVVWSSLALHHVRDLDTLLTVLAGMLTDGGTLAIADLERDRDGAFHADKVDFDGHHGFDRVELTEQLGRAGFTDVAFQDATSIAKDGRDFGVFLCTARRSPR